MKKNPFLTALAVGAATALAPCCAPAQAAPTIYFSANNDSIYKFTPPGPKVLVAQLPFGTNPEGLAFDTSGNLFVAGGGDVSKITPGGEVSLFATLPPGSFGGYGMAIDSGNNLYVAGAATVQIVKITPAGTVSIYATLSGGTTGLALDSIGNLYALGGGNGNAVQKIPAGGGPASIYATLPGPNNYGLAFDSSGYLYASDLTNANLFKIPPGGGSYTTFGTLIAGSDGLVFDDNGNLYAANPYADAISVITPDGTASVFASGLNTPRYLAFQPGTPFFLRITAVDKIGNDFRVSCTSESGKSYELQSRADFATGDWASLPGTTTSGTGGTLQITATNAFSLSQQFYRVRELP
jgi:sugar lactone lactonase YvrE